MNTYTITNIEKKSMNLRASVKYSIGGKDYKFKYVFPLNVDVHAELKKKGRELEGQIPQGITNLEADIDKVFEISPMSACEECLIEPEEIIEPK